MKIVRRDRDRYYDINQYKFNYCKFPAKMNLEQAFAFPGCVG